MSHPYGATASKTTTTANGKGISVFDVRAKQPRDDHEGEHRKGLWRQILADHIPPTAATVTDLGAGPCIFARIASEAGLKVTAVDGRTTRLPEELGAVTFVESDIRDFDVSPFDVVVMFGVLYHLELADQIKLLRQAKDKILVLDTQVHVPELVTDISGPWAHEIVTIGDHEGVVFPERDNPMASIGNPSSFWQTEPSLLHTLAISGFPSVLRVGDFYISKYGARRFYVVGTSGAEGM